MKTMKRSILVLLFIQFAAMQLLHAEYFKHIGLSEGLTQPSVMSIYQDKLGRMWFGTREGINMYDGSQLTTYKGQVPSNDSSSSLWLGNEVMCIAGDGEGNIYFLVDKDLIKYNLRAESWSRINHGHLIPTLTSYKGDIWFTRHDSLFCQSAKNDQPLFKLKIQTSAEVNSLTILADRICVGTKKGLILINRQSGYQEQLLSGIDIYRVFESSQKELWIGTRMDGLYRLPLKGKMIQVPYQPNMSVGISSLQIRDFIEDDDHNIWFGTFNGLQKYDYENKQYSLIQIPKYIGGLSHPSIFPLYKDTQGNIWVGTYFGGVSYFTPRRDRFMHFDYDQNEAKSPYYSYIGDIIPDKNNHLWLGTDGGGISCIDKNWKTIRQLTAGDRNSLPHNNIKSICYDEKNEYLYIGTYLGGLSRYNIRTGQFYNYLDKEKKNLEMPNGIVFHTKMWNGQLYLSARNGVFSLDPENNTFKKLHSSRIFYEDFDIDPDGNFYLSGWNLLQYFNLKNPKDIIRLPLPEGKKVANITCIKATKEGVYIGTLGTGLFYYNKITRKFTHYSYEKNQLPSNFCYNICVTENGDVLLTSDKGVSCFNPIKQSITTINLMSDFPSAHIIRGCGISATTDGRIYVGDTKGISTFTIDEFKQVTPDYDNSCLYFSQLWINNQPINAGDKTNILKESLPYTEELNLGYEQNNIIIRFAWSNYERQFSERWFKYRLEGFDKGWIETDQTELHYTNLSPGKYTLHVSAISNNHASKDIAMQIVIASPWYSTWWSYLIYLTIIISCIGYYVSSKISKRTLALSLEKERFEKQHIEQVNQEKLVFFTNVSHEFRTPLTLIMSHIDILLQKNTFHLSIYNQLLKIRKNAQQMTNLISELLEFRKLDQNHKTIQLVQRDLSSFLKEIYFSFSDYAHQRNIHYEFQIPESPIMYWFDAQLLEKVFFNLLSNAFKYTPDKGYIVLSGQIVEGNIEISISDTGSGISEDETKQIFECFFQGNNNATNNKNQLLGTGIGLALSKSIIEKHHGNIIVESTVGKGSKFTVSLPLDISGFKSDPNICISDSITEATIIPGSLFSLPEVRNMIEEIPEAELPLENSHTLLLVEDNQELLDLLKELFAPFYHIITATNGKEGLKQVYENKPNLIISDIMMPEMSGTEMCLQLKNNIDFCHIPIILLTALNTTEQNIEGLNRGADDYITKPFNAQLLLVRANNLLRNRLMIQHQFNKQPISEIDLTSINPLDKDLLKRASQTIEQHIDNTEFGISELCKELGIGRSLLYAKFKALTGMTPNNFILNYKLKYAATLLQQYPTLPIAEISDRIGFNSPVYFSQCFKKQYGATPQTYRKKKGDSLPEES